MSYAIAHIVYGIPLQNADGYLKRRWSEELEEAIENEDEGFITPYSGSSEVTPAAFAVEIGTFDEACHHIEASTLKAMLQPTFQVVDKWRDNFKALSESLRTELSDEKYGEPRVFILWGTS